jgi:lipid II:glycine glycyltransferase (peptidoglycan interpeptide bridge formation enzyme)
MTKDRIPRVVEITDREQWNGLVLGRPHYELEQGWEWGEIQRGSGWNPHRYAAFAGSACVGLASVVSGRIPGLPYSVLDACRGPLVDLDDDGAWRGLLSAVRQLAVRERAIVLRVSPSVPHDNVEFRDALADHGFQPLADDWTTWSPARVVVTLRLDADEETLRRRCRKSVRNEIAAAQRRGVSVRVAHDRADVVAFHRIMVTAGREKGYPVRPLARLEALWRAYVVRGNGVLLLTESQGALVGGLLGTRMGNRAYLQSAAVVRTDARIYQGPLVYWEFIRWAKAAGCVHLDWGGSGTRFPPRATDQGYGLYQFKAGFGSALHYSAPYHDLVFRPQLYRLGRAFERWALPRAWRLRALLNH